MSRNDIFNKELSEPWFSLMKLGLKTCEGRLKKGIFADIKPGDIIHFYNNDFGFRRHIKMEVKCINYHNTFNEYLTKEGAQFCLPGIENVKEGMDIYYNYYSLENEKKYGVVALWCKLI